ncbi:hypothetical protein J1N35_015248 [Gossypium stocksii]|uniref:Uncharacterized protein n=1 Tax=Gossypium stocksii TaxID=47602 RepID=A0A9D3VW26_9ROSI|nr:hypothetical protein J1N35_015248 [Gossypium stocksii]
MEEFRDFVSLLEVTNLGAVGSTFTWSNLQQSNFITKKLDRVLVNSFWLLEFSYSHAKFLAPEVSDHCPSVALKEVETSFYRQKARVQWLIKSDQSTKFFHSAVNVRQNNLPFNRCWMMMASSLMLPRVKSSWKGFQLLKLFTCCKLVGLSRLIHCVLGSSGKVATSKLLVQGLVR